MYKELETIKNQYKINIINISIRFVRGNSESLLTYAPTDSFAFVLYVDILHPIFHSKKAEKWTQKLINAALNCGGTYYLPYAFFGTQQQLYRSYPNFIYFAKLKQKYDPKNIFQNSLWQKYGHDKRLSV